MKFVHLMVGTVNDWIVRSKYVIVILMMFCFLFDVISGLY